MPIINLGVIPKLGLEIIKNPNQINKKAAYIGIVENKGVDLEPIIFAETPEDILIKYEKMLKGIDYEK